MEELKRQVNPKRAHTDDDAGDSHDLIAKFDNCDLSDHRREGTRVQNRRNVQVGSHDNQQKPHTVKDGFLYHTCLGLVGWMHGLLVMSILATTVVMFQRRSLREGMPRRRTKSFGSDSKEQTL